MEDRKLTEEEKKTIKEFLETLTIKIDFDEMVRLNAENDKKITDLYDYIERAKKDHKRAKFGHGKWKHIKIKDQSDEIEAHKVMFESTLQNNRKRAKITAEGSPLRSYFLRNNHSSLYKGLLVGYAVKGLMEGSNIPEAVKELESAKETLLKFEEIDGIEKEISTIDGLLRLFKLTKKTDWLPFIKIGHEVGFTPNQAYNYAKRITTKEINEKSFKRFYKESKERNTPTKAKE